MVFTRNALCALTSDQISATPDTLLATLLRSDVRLGTSTPEADPSGDYAWALFRQAETIQPGAYAQLDFVKQELGLGEDDEIVGFLYLGTPNGEPPRRNAPDPAEFFSNL